MRIRKLELQGFKSFPDRTSFVFDAGVSGVIGPNGCGKSNIVDAVLWCLGEQSPRVLRGRSMEDVIFAGSADRAPTSFAEVSITFEAGDIPFPGDWAHMAEIQIARRLYRDGHSEYYLNQQRVRLRDIHDLFLDTGISNRMYCVIEQGRIGEIVNAKPEQRRSLIEEAAGISRYKVRKKEAEEKLGETLGNLERVSEVSEELGKRVRSLERQVGNATRYRRLRCRVRQGELFLGLARFAGLAGDRKALGDQLREAQTEEENLIRRGAQREAEIAAIRASLEGREATVGRLRDRLAEVEASRRESESARQYQGRESAELTRRLETLGQQEARAAKEHADATRLLQETLAEKAKIEASLLAGEQRLEGARQEAESAERALQERRRRIEDGKAAILGRVTELTRARTGREGLAARRAELEGRLVEARKRQGDHSADLSALDGATKVAAEEERAASQRLLAARAAIEEAKKELERREKGRGAAAAEVKRAQEALSAEERKEHALRARLESLSQMQARHDGVEDGVRAALAVPGVIGALSTQLDVTEADEAALGVALGEALDAVLVPDERTAIAARAAAKGRAVIVRIDGVRPPGSGFAARIQGTEAGRAALGRLLGAVAECPDLARALAHQSGTGEPAISACGAFVDRRGAVIVGPHSGPGALLLARRREINRLSAELTTQVEHVHAREAGLALATADLDAATAEVEAGRGKVEAARVAASEAELAARDAGHAHRERIKEQERAAAAARQIAREEADLVAALADCSKKDQSLGEAVQQAEAALSKVEETLKADQVALPGEDAAASRAREALSQLRAEVATLRERVVGLRRTEASAQSASAASERQVQTCQSESATARERLGVLREDDQRLGELLGKLGAEEAELQRSLEEERERVRAERASLQEAEARIKDLRERREAAIQRRVDLERQMADIREEINRIRETLDERYQVSVAAMLDRLDRDGHVVLEVDEAAQGPRIPDDDGNRWKNIEPVEDLRVTLASLDDAEFIQGWVDRLQAAREKLKSLGDVNLVAVDEYVEVAAEFATLEKQRADLDESVKSIRQTIARLNRTCRERFRETFDRVDAYFRELYPRLVGGGQARLALTNEEDLLETGVDIYVQPPGKRLVHLSLLSGGETAMTAIALLFSLFREKPSPFCLLDEVDAPLDEGNGARFNGLLREMAAGSQFIVITHNKKTMECMDTLYGVTMPAPGVSKLVTVRLS